MLGREWNLRRSENKKPLEWFQGVDAIQLIVWEVQINENKKNREVLRPPKIKQVNTIFKKKSKNKRGEKMKYPIKTLLVRRLIGS